MPWYRDCTVQYKSSTYNRRPAARAAPGNTTVGAGLPRPPPHPVWGTGNNRPVPVVQCPRECAHAHHRLYTNNSVEMPYVNGLS